MHGAAARLVTMSRVLLIFAIAAALVGCGSSPNYQEVPTAKLPASAVPPGPPPAPPNGATASGNAPDYSKNVAPSAPTTK